MREGGDDGWREMLEVESKSYVNNDIPLTLNYSPTLSHPVTHMYTHVYIHEHPYNDTHADTPLLADLSPSLSTNSEREESRLF